MAIKRSVAVAAGVSSALLAALGAFAVATELLGDRPADRVGTFQPTELRLVPAVADADPSEQLPPVTGTDGSASTPGATRPATPDDEGSRTAAPDDKANARSGPLPAAVAPAPPTTAHQRDDSNGTQDSGGDDHGGTDGDD